MNEWTGKLKFIFAVSFFFIFNNCVLFMDRSNKIIYDSIFVSFSEELWKLGDNIIWN